MKTRKILSAVVVAILVLSMLSLAGCGSSASTASSSGTTNSSSSAGSGGASSGGGPAKGGTLNYAETADFTSFDPALAGDGFGVRGAQFLFTRLLRYTGPKNNQLVGALADSWKWSDDGKSVTFTLRKGLKFSDGSALTADDVAFTFTRLLDPKTKAPYQGSFKVIKGAQDFIDGKATSVAGIVVVDPQTVRFDLNSSVPYFLNAVALPTAGIVSRAAVEKAGTNFGQNPVGSGPFMLQSWTKGQEVKMVRNPNYYLTGQPYLDGVDIKIGVDTNLQLMMLQKGQIDYMQSLDSATYLAVQNDPNLKPNYQGQDGPRFYYMGMNVTMPPFDNKLVRQAMNYAVNKDTLVQLENGRASVASSVIPPWSPAQPTIQPYPYDPEKAKQLLAQAGYPNGFSVDMLVPDYFENPKIAQSIQGDLQKVGIKLNLQTQAYPVFRATVAKPNTVKLFNLQWTTDYPDPQNIISMLLNGARAGQQNFTFYNNPDVNKLLDQADTTQDAAKRADLYKQAETIIHDDAPWVFEIYFKTDDVHSPKLIPPKDSYGRIPIESNEMDHFDAVTKAP